MTAQSKASRRSGRIDPLPNLERAVLGAVLQQANGTLEKALRAGVDQATFTRPLYRRCWAAVEVLRAEGVVPELIAVEGELEHQPGQLTDDERSELLDLGRTVWSTSNVETYSGELVELRDRRRMVENLWDVTAAVEAGTPGWQDQLSTIRSMAQPARTLRDRLVSGGQLSELDPPTALVEGLLFDPGVSMVYGPPKTGKSFWSLTIAAAVAEGARFDSRSTTARPVLYVAAEGVGGLGPRARAWEQYQGRSLPSTLHFLLQPVQLSDPDHVHQLAALAAELNAGLVVVDTLARCSLGMDENSARDVGLMVAGLDRLRDAAGHVLVVHHSGKDLSRGARGNSAILGAVDTELTVTGGEGRFQVETSAQKDALPAVTSHWRLQPVEGSGSVVAVPAALTEDDVRPSYWTVLEALAQIETPDGVAPSAWEASLEGVSRPTFYRARKWLLENGHLEVLGTASRPRYRTVSPPEEGLSEP